MNKADLVEAVARATGSTKTAAASSVDAVIDAISRSLEKGDKVSLAGFGTFEVRTRAARTARNPQTGAVIKLRASKAPVFRAGKNLKDLVKGARR